MDQEFAENFAQLCNVRSTTNEATTPQTFTCLKIASKANTYKVFHDQFEQPIGYIIWANINKESLARIERSGVYPQYPFEWSEGNITLLIDIVINNVNKKNAKQQLKQFIKAQRILAYTKKNVGKMYFKKQGKLQLAGKKKFALPEQQQQQQQQQQQEN